jgi:thioredoxin reductase (NADPH)
MAKIHDVLIIGSGPAGLTAAIYAARANLSPLVIAGREPGGQLMLTTEVDNYPGFPEGIMGPDLMKRMRDQAARFGTVFLDADVTDVDFSQPIHNVRVGADAYHAKTVILSTGASALWLGLESERRLRGKGVSSCATCDGFFFRGKEIVVIGGGDTAMEEATFLTKFATKVTVIHRRGELRASKIMQDKARNNPKISFLFNMVVEEILGEQKVEGLRLKNIVSNEMTHINAKGVFLAIGHKPNTDIFLDQPLLIRNAQGYLVPEQETVTKIPGIFVAGDVFDFRYRQAITAAASGCKAALNAESYLESPEIIAHDTQRIGAYD